MELFITITKCDRKEFVGWTPAELEDYSILVVHMTVGRPFAKRRAGES
jgi:hypothetical protein